MQLNIGRESRAVELERLRTEMLQLKDGIMAQPQGHHAPPAHAPPPYPPPQYAYPPPYGAPPHGYPPPAYGQSPAPPYGAPPPYGQSPMMMNDGEMRPAGPGGADETPGGGPGARPGPRTHPKRLVRPSRRP